jgi:hypothetical protein
MRMLDGPRPAASHWSPLSLKGAAAVVFSFAMLFSAFAMITAIAFYLFDIRVTMAWQESSPPPAIATPVPVSQEIEKSDPGTRLDGSN